MPNQPTTNQEEWKDRIYQICTYYSELGEGTCGYDLSEDKFQKLFSLIDNLLITDHASISAKIGKKKNTKEHFCAFNDGDDHCECFNAGLELAQKIVEGE